MIFSYLLLQILIYGAFFGLTYALISIGFTLVFGVSKILNLSYGALYMTTAYLVYYFAVMLGIPLIASVLMSLVVSLLIGLAIFYSILKFNVNPMVFMITMLLFALLLQYLYSYIFGGEIGLIIPGLFSSQSIGIAGASVQISLLVAAIISILLVVGTWLWIDRSSFGRKIRATSEDPEIAETLGINTRRIVLIVLSISIVFVSIAAVLVVPSQEVSPEMWINPFVIAFAVSIIGGLGKFQWILPSAFIVSFAEVTTQYLVPYNISDISAFLIVILFILVFPNGLGGVKHGT